MAVDAEFQVLAERMDGIGRDIVEIKDDLKSIVAGMERIVRLEERYDNHGKALERSFAAITGLEGRMKTLEAQEPINKMVSKWVMTGVIGIVGILGLQVVSFVFTTKQQQPVNITIDRGALEEPRR